MKFPFASSSRDFLIQIKRNASRGSTMVETSLGLGLFLFLIFCLFSILWMSYHFVVAQYLATEAVRQLVVLSRTEATALGGTRDSVIRTALCNGTPAGDTRFTRLYGRAYLMDLGGFTGGGCAGAIQIMCLSGTCSTNAGDAGDFVSVRINVNSGIFGLINRGAGDVGEEAEEAGDIASVAPGADLTFAQGGISFNGMALGRNEPIVDQ